MWTRWILSVGIVVLIASVASLLTAQPDLEAERALKMKDEGPADPSAPKTRNLAEPQRTDRAGKQHSSVDKGNKCVPVTYDDGIVTAVPAMSGYSFGNRFDTVNGALIKSFSVTRITFYMMPMAGTDNVFASIFGGPGTGTTASVLTSASVPLNNGPGAFNTHTFSTPLTGTGSFLAGIWYVAGDTIGLGSGTVGGQGHHGIKINDVGTGFTTLPGLNALVGASTACIPVELMDFTVSDE